MLEVFLPITCLSDLIPTQHAELHDSMSQSGSGYVNYVKHPPLPLHNSACFCHSSVFGVNAAKVQTTNKLSAATA